MEQRLTHTQTTKLILAPQLRQFLKLLELPLYELEQRLDQELTQNPTLEEEPSSTEDTEISNQTPEETFSDARIQDAFETMERNNHLMSEEVFMPDFSEIDDESSQRRHHYQQSIITKNPTLADYLRWQLNLSDLAQDEPAVADEIIGNIDEDGRLVITLEEIAAALNVSCEKVEQVLRKIQMLEPPGIGARDLQETLLLQLKRKGLENTLAFRIVHDYLPLLERKQFDQLARSLGTTPDRIRSAYQVISKCEPKPGRVFYQEKPNFVVPDAIVSIDPEHENQLTIEIPDEWIPKLRINAHYRRMLKSKEIDQATKAFLRQKIQSGLELIRALSQRKSTIRRITEELVSVQHDFFMRGFAFLKPLRLKDVAEKIGVHESTVSRAIQAKYVETPQGTIPYKSFFSTKLATHNGALESQASAKERIKTLINSEDKRHPLSDTKLVGLLDHEGVKIARRTVAKYRELLKILPAHLRKER